MAKSAEAAKKAVQKFYPNLLEVLPITELVERFYSGHILSHHQKSKLDGLPSRKDKVAYFLDEMLVPGLSMNCTKHFDEMITMMKESDDILAKHLVELMVEDLMPTTVSSPSPTSPATSVTADTSTDTGNCGIVPGILQPCRTVVWLCQTTVRQEIFGR